MKSAGSVQWIIGKVQEELKLQQSDSIFVYWGSKVGKNWFYLLSFECSIIVQAVERNYNLLKLFEVNLILINLGNCQRVNF